MITEGIPLEFGSRGHGQLSYFVCETFWAWYRIDFVQSLSNFKYKLLMMRGEVIFILGHSVKGQGQLWNIICLTDRAQKLTLTFDLMTQNQ